MTDSISDRLAELGITLPEAAAPVAAYVPAVEIGGLALHFRAAAVPRRRLADHRPARRGYDVAHGQEAAERCAVMLIAQMKAALGSLDRVERIVKLGAFIASDPHFTDQPKVANGASELMEKVFGEAGRHARSAVGVPVLPLGAAVEIDAIVAVKAG